MRTLWPEPAKMEETHIPTKTPKHLVTVADFSESQGLEEHTVWHREPKRSGRATRAVSVLMQKKEGSFGPLPRRKPTALCFSRTSRDPDACSEARLGSTCSGFLLLALLLPP